jgi:hypothetical protein
MTCWWPCGRWTAIKHFQHITEVTRIVCGAAFAAPLSSDEPAMPRAEACEREGRIAVADDKLAWGELPTKLSGEAPRYLPVSRLSV